MQKLINLSNYPIDQPSDRLSIVVDQVRSDLKKDGCAIIRGFLSKEGVSELIKETTSVAHYAHHSSACLLYTSPSPRDGLLSRMPSSA